MTDKKLKELLIVIDNRYGRVRSKEDRIIDFKTCVQAFGMVPDEIVEKALYAAFAKCRFPNQIIIDWCEEIKKLQATVKPSANDLWAQAATAARQITANLYYMTHGGLVTPTGKLTGEDFKTRNAEIFATLPVAVQRWAGSPAELSTTFGRDSADLLQFVKPGFIRAVQDAPVENLKPPHCPAGQRHRLEVEMQLRSIVSLACAVSLFTGSALASAVYTRRVDELTMERDIYASQKENWMNKAVERKETIEQMQTEVEQLTDTLAADQSIALTYAGEFHCTAYCSEEYPHICGEGQGITSSGAKVQPGVTVAADTSIFPYGTVILIEGVGMRVVQDTGSLIKENTLDVAVGTHAEAISWSGWGSHKVWIVTGGETDAAE